MTSPTLNIALTALCLRSNSQPLLGERQEHLVRHDPIVNEEHSAKVTETGTTKNESDKTINMTSYFSHFSQNHMKKSIILTYEKIQHIFFM